MAISGGRSFLGNSGGMRPDVVAATLVEVEDEWTAQAAAFVECGASSEAGLNCAAPRKAFAKSCDTIVSAVVQASSGDRDRVSEYMGDVCKESALVNERRTRCQGLAALIAQQMSADSYSNREAFDAQPLCANLFERVSADEKVSIEKRKAEELNQAKAEAEHKKAEEEAAKKRQAEEDAVVAAAAKKAEEAAKAEQEADAAAKAAEEAAKKATPPVAKKAPPAAAKVQKETVAAKVQKPAAKVDSSSTKPAPAGKVQKAADAPAHKK